MELSFLYHSFGISRSYEYHATEYKDNAIILKLKSFSLTLIPQHYYNLNIFST